MDLREDILHIFEDGAPVCWKKMSKKELRARRRTCILVEEPGTSEICGRCCPQRKRRRAHRQTRPETDRKDPETGKTGQVMTERG